MKNTKTGIMCLAAGLLAVSSTMAMADVGHSDGPDFGRTGDARLATRTYEIRMGEMYFTPNTVRVMPGETVRFIVINEGEAVHEFNLGNEDAWEAHAAEMNRMVDEGMIEYDVLRHTKMRQMGMMHADPNAVLLEPGERAEIIWTFPDEVTEIGIACNVPGHRESGMIQDVIFRSEG